MKPGDVYELEPVVYHAFIRHMDRERRANERARKR